MSILLGDNFSLSSKKPLDGRIKYDTLAEMRAQADSTLYEGCLAYCIAVDKTYQWKSTNPVDPDTGRWREFSSGGSGGESELADLDDVEITSPAAGQVLKYDSEEEKWVNGDDAGGEGRAKSEAIAPIFDATATYAEGDRVMYEDELYVFNTDHTGAWDAADADKSDVDSEMPEKLTAAQMAAIKAAFVIDAPRNGYPVLFDETGAEHFVGWYKLANGTKKPVYEKTLIGTLDTMSGNYCDTVISTDSTIEFKEYMGTLYRASDGTTFVVPYGQHWNSSGNSDWFVSLFQLSSKNIIVRFSASSTDSSSYSYKIRIRFTKTTDTPQ